MLYTAMSRSQSTKLVGTHACTTPVYRQQVRNAKEVLIDGRGRPATDACIMWRDGVVESFGVSAGEMGDMLILLLYWIPLFTCCIMGETKIWQFIGYFGKN